MRQTILNTDDNKFYREGQQLNISHSKIEISLNKDEVREGSFFITGSCGKITKGFVFSSHFRMVCVTKEFQWKEGEVFYRFQSRGLEEGSIICGQLHIISTEGEYYLPFRVSISYSVPKSTQGPIKNVFLFANLAKTKFQEAVNLYYKKSFEGIFKEQDKDYGEYYRGLSMYKGSSQAVEEFLIAIRKKEPVSFQIQLGEWLFHDVEKEEEKELIIQKKGWGYIELFAEASGDFIHLIETKIQEDDFKGDNAHFKYEIRPKYLHRGRNYGKIQFYNGYEKLEFSIIVEQNLYPEKRKKQRREGEKQFLFIMRQYIAFRTRQISLNQWLYTSMEGVEAWLGVDGNNPLPRLFQIQLFLADEKYQEAGRLLKYVEREFQMSHSHGFEGIYFLYLTALYKREEGYVDQVRDFLREIYEKGDQRFVVLWALIYLDEGLGRNRGRRFKELERQFHLGCRSPILYTEAYSIMKKDKELMEKLTSFEIQVILWAFVHGQGDRGVIERMIALWGTVREFDLMKLKLLEKCYEHFPTEEILSCACKMLIQGNRTNEKYFFWFELGVEANLRITKLYESYIASLPLSYDKPLPKTALIYFTYTNDLNQERKAFLYANVLKYREEYMELAKSYEASMETFVMEQLEQRRMNPWLALLYNHILKPEKLSPKQLEDLGKIINVQRLIVKEKNIQEVGVVHKRLVNIKRYPVIHGESYIPLYGDEFQLFFFDELGNCYKNSVSYELEKMMDFEKYMSAFFQYPIKDPKLALMLCDSNKHYVSISNKNVFYYWSLLEYVYVKTEYKREIWEALVRFYYERDYLDDLDMLLFMTNPKMLSQKERGVLVDFMTRRGLYEDAFRHITFFGMEEISPKILVRIFSSYIRESEGLEDEIIISMAFEIFSMGKYDEVILYFLLENFNGLTKDMRDIWKAGKRFNMDTGRMAERLVIQMLFTLNFVEERDLIFEDYVKAGASEKVIYKYLSQCAFEYYIKDMVFHEKIFQYMMQYGKKEEGSHICRLALLKYYGEHREALGEDEEILLLHYVEQFLEKHIFLNCFMKYRDKIPALEEFQRKTIIEYKTGEKGKVYIHYLIHRENKKEKTYEIEEMHPIIEGVYSKEFLLFFGEIMEYYITEEIEGREVITTKKGKIENRPMESGNSERRFDILNNMAVSQSLQDEEAFLKGMEGYGKMDYLVLNLFKGK